MIAMFKKKSLLPIIVSGMAGYLLMSYEIVAARLIAPLLGASIYTWGATIGVVLFGMMIGAKIGGYATESYSLNLRRPLTLVFGFFAAYLILVFFGQEALGLIVNNLNLQLPFFALMVASCIVFVPAVLLAMVGPISMKLHAKSVEHIGRDYGNLSFAWSFGSILGVFLSAFVVVPMLGTTHTLIHIIVLAALVTLLCVSSKKKANSLSILVILSAIGLGIFWFGTTERPVYASAYYDIRVIDKPYQSIEDTRWLFLDFDSHSIDTKDEPIGAYTDTLAAMPEIFYKNEKPENILILGAGAYTIPKKLAQIYPSAQIDVVEIDPILELVAQEKFGLSEEGYANINTIIGDPRFLLSKDGALKSSYDIIFHDVYQSFISVPAHLSTQEFLEDLFSRLSPGGAYLASFIGTIEGPGEKLAQHVFVTHEKALESHKESLDGDIFGKVEGIFLGTNKTSISSFVVLVKKTTQELSEKQAPSFYTILNNQKEVLKFLGLYEYKLSPQEIENTRPFTDLWNPTDRFMRPITKRYFPLYKKIFYANTSVR